MRTKSPALRIALLALSVALLLAGSGCAKYYVDTNLTDSSFKPRGKSIAVISGTKEEQNVYLAALVAVSLHKMSRFQVMSPEQVSKALAPYPLTVKGPYRSAYLSIDTDWELGDRKKIAEIQRALGVDYLYVIWAPISVQHNNSDPVVPAVAQLFEHPNAKEVAETELRIIVGDKDSPNVKDGVEEVARQLAEQTHMGTVAKK